jgi:hypothetical protein
LIVIAGETPTIVPPAPNTGILPDGSEVATPEVSPDRPAIVALEEQAKVESVKRATEAAALTHAAVATEVKATELADATSAKAVALADATGATAAVLAADASAKAADLADAATARALVLAGATQSSAVAIAVAKALRDQHVDHVLEGHGKRLDNIEAHGVAVEKTLEDHGNVLGRIETKVDAGIEASKTAAAKRLSTRTFTIATFGVLTTMVGTTVAFLGATGNL